MIVQNLFEYLLSQSTFNAIMNAVIKRHQPEPWEVGKQVFKCWRRMRAANIMDGWIFIWWRACAKK